MIKLILAIALAASLWFLMFSQQLEFTRHLHEQFFWQAMSCSTLLLCGLTIVLQRDRLRQLFALQPRFVWIGIVHAILLYALSRLGVFLMSWLFDWTIPHIQAVYATRMQVPPNVIAPLLFFVIAPCEEIFWRGYVQNRISELTSPQRGMIVTTILYAVVHVWALNPMLLIAATVLGVHWGFLYRRFGSLVPGIISHALWDTTIFVLFPVQF